MYVLRNDQERRSGRSRPHQGLSRPESTSRYQNRTRVYPQVVFFELYMDEAAFQTHVTRPDIAEAISGCAGLLKEGTSVVIDQLVVVV